MKISVFWFRRDLRLEDNIALYQVLSKNKNVLPIFIFDTNIINELPKDDARISFIYENLKKIDTQLKEYNSSLLVFKGKPIDVWKELMLKYEVTSIYFNKDYEPYAIKRDAEIIALAKKNNIVVSRFKDQVIFEENEVLKDNKEPYTVFTPYKNKWLTKASSTTINSVDCISLADNFYRFLQDFPTIESLGFCVSNIKVKPYILNDIKEYDQIRNFPYIDKTTYLSPHLRFGTISIRGIYHKAKKENPIFLNELIWREFFMQILFHYPKVITQNFKSKYDGISWRNNQQEFQLWCEGKTGYPFVDAGMRQLNETGYMHNRVRMITAGFLCKHLLIDWRWGEAYFAKKLLDYDLSANNGNWQWASGTGCDAAPYFRVFNPTEQIKKFDNELKYIKKWVDDYEESTYPQPIVEHGFARKRALETYRKGLI